ncbi:hypothetical protein CALCODRAFT_509811 [Calocera cornea HHB12733]|uniref:Uncharacterized protein n=1 Tax=Calocera cornea HHB12733 TaxID=1353952 RepID=A0A165EZ81_9BASI|nr:hypothetical protein CALCODRAFT_509811 [Calocera cornea HHB12733]
MSASESLQALFFKPDAASIRDAIEGIATRHDDIKPYIHQLWETHVQPLARYTSAITHSGPYRSRSQRAGKAVFTHPSDLVVSTILTWELPICDSMSAIDVILSNAYPPQNNAQARIIATIGLKWHRLLFPDYGYGRVSFVPLFSNLATVDFVPAGITIPPTLSTTPYRSSPTPGSASSTTQLGIPQPTPLTQPPSPFIPAYITRAKSLHRQRRESYLENVLGSVSFNQYKRCVEAACNTHRCIDVIVPKGGTDICMCYL